MSVHISILDVFSNASSPLWFKRCLTILLSMNHCFEWSLSNYLAGMTSLKLKKAWEEEKVLPAE